MVREERRRRHLGNGRGGGRAAAAPKASGARFGSTAWPGGKGRTWGEGGTGDAANARKRDRLADKYRRSAGVRKTFVTRAPGNSEFTNPMMMMMMMIVMTRLPAKNVEDFRIKLV